MSEYIVEYLPDTTSIEREEIVRCRDCVKWDHDSTYPKKACFEFSDPEDGYIVATSPDGFCAWAERRGDDAGSEPARRARREADGGELA